MTGRRVAIGALALVLAAGCRDDAARPVSRTDAAVVLAGLDHTLLGVGGRRGTLRADTALFGDQLGSVRLVLPVLNIAPSPSRPQPIEIAADSGMLDVATEVVRLIRLRRIAGGPTSLLNADTVAYDPAGDSLWSVPGGRVR